MFCRHCSQDHERKCQCGHTHSAHIYAGGCTECWHQFKVGIRKRDDVCEHYDQRPIYKNSNSNKKVA